MWHRNGGMVLLWQNCDFICLVSSTYKMVIIGVPKKKANKNVFSQLS